MINSKFFIRDITYAYAPLFITAILFSVIGTTIWPILMYLNIQSDNITLFHKLFMIGGFLSTFADGFFLTAFTSFTRTNKIRLIDLIVVMTFKVTMLLGFFLDSIEFSLFAYCMNSLAVGFFIVNRYFKKIGDFPASFYFVFLALIYGFIYFGLSLINIYVNLDLNFSYLDTLLHVMIPMNLILGVGLKIVPVFFGIPAKGCFSIGKNKDTKLLTFLKEKKILISVILFNLVFLLDISGFVLSANILRVCIISYLFFTVFKIHTKPRVISFITFGMWQALWMIYIGLILRMFSNLYIFATHLYFIGGVTTFTFMVASRVTLAHGGFSLDFERTKKEIYWVGTLFIGAAVLRFLPAVFTFASYEHFILCSWILLIMSILLWIKIYGQKLLAPILRRSL